MNQFFSKCAYIIFLIVGIGLIVFGIYGIKHTEGFLETTAIITQIDTEYNIDPGNSDQSDYIYHVFIRYTVGGLEYERELGEYDASMCVNKQIKILYNPEDPTEAVSASPLGTILKFAFGGVSTIVGVVMLLQKKKEEEENMA